MLWIILYTSLIDAAMIWQVSSMTQALLRRTNSPPPTFAAINMSNAASNVQAQIAMAFPTLIGRFQFPGTQSFNASLLNLLMEKETQLPSSDYANVGGWHSSGDLLEWPGEEFVQLRSWFGEAITKMVQATAQLPEVQGRSGPPRGSFRLSAWANISRRGQYHRMHNHPNSAWSGCYYVTGDEKKQGLGGVLEFYDPRPFTEMVDVPGAPYGQRMHIRPTPGLLVIFPSWLYHFVHPNDSDDARVSIAFNASWHPATT